MDSDRSEPEGIVHALIDAHKTEFSNSIIGNGWSSHYTEQVAGSMLHLMRMRKLAVEMGLY